MKLLSSITLLFGMTIATYAADAVNGLSINGLGINGMTSNALTINGFTLNRMSFNALTINGTTPVNRKETENPLAALASAGLAK